MKTFTLATVAAVAGLSAAAPAPQANPVSPETKGWLLFTVESASNPEYNNQTITFPHFGSSVPIQIAPVDTAARNSIYGQLRGPNDYKQLFVQDEVVDSPRFQVGVQGSTYPGILGVSAIIPNPNAPDVFTSFKLQGISGSDETELVHLDRAASPGPGSTFLACDNGRVTYLQYGPPGVYGSESQVSCASITIKARDVFITPCLDCDKE